MTITYTGDMAQQFQSLRATKTIKSDLARLSSSLSSGRAPDLVAHLGGDTTRLGGLNHSLVKLDGFLQASRETSIILDTMQTAITAIDTTRSQLTDTLLLVTDASTTVQAQQAGETARAALDKLVAVSNTRTADRALFGGRNVESAPLADAAIMLDDIIAQIGTDRSFAGIRAAVVTWFDDPAGGFANIGYRGAGGPDMQRQISQDETVTLSARADDQALRDVLRGAVLATLSATLPGIDRTTKIDLLKAGGETLFGAASGLVAMQSRIGTAQARTAETQAETIAQQSSLQIAVNDLVSVDPFETAVRLQDVQRQLETNYSVIGRMSQLSLLRFI